MYNMRTTVVTLHCMLTFTKRGELNCSLSHTNTHTCAQAHTKKIPEVMHVLINLMAGIFLQCICVPNHPINTSTR